MEKFRRLDFENFGRFQGGVNIKDSRKQLSK